MVRYTLKQLYYFTAVADHGGIAQAARALNLSQPAIAQALNKLEEQYELVLFLRQHSRGVELTAQGRQLYTQAQHLLTEAEEQEKEEEGRREAQECSCSPRATTQQWFAIQNAATNAPISC